MDEFINFENAQKIFNFFKNNVNYIPWGLLTFIILFALFRTSDFFLIISKFQGLFAGASSLISKSKIQNEINGRVLKSSKKICKELGEVIPYEVKINWVKETNKKQFIEGNKVVICMDHKRTQHQNVVYALNDYVVNGLIPKARLYIDDEVMKSSHLVMTRKLLMLSYKKGIDFYLENILNKSIQDAPDLKDLVDKLITLDESGMFVQILLREFMSKSRKLYGKTINEEFKNESRHFLNFIYKIATRESGDNTTPLLFSEKFFKIGIILVANNFTYYRHKEDAYIRRFVQNLQKGIESIYLLARGSEKKEIAKKVKEELEQKNLHISNIKEFEYIGRYNNYEEYKCICIAFDIDTFEEAEAV